MPNFCGNMRKLCFRESKMPVISRNSDNDKDYDEDNNNKNNNNNNNNNNKTHAFVSV